MVSIKAALTLTLPSFRQYVYASVGFGMDIMIL